MSDAFDFSKTKIPAKVAQSKSNKKDTIPELEYDNKRGENASQLNLQDLADKSKRNQSLSEIESNANESSNVAQLMNLNENINLSDKQDLTHQKENNTGLPDDLKSGVESLSGHSMDDVKVFRNSEKPAQLQASAYAQGTDIHLAPGQEKHLPHEAWHVAQQKQGKVKPTTQLKGNVNVNDDPALENEADIMGSKAASLVQRKSEKQENAFQLKSSADSVVQMAKPKMEKKNASKHIDKLAKGGKTVEQTQKGRGKKAGVTAEVDEGKLNKSSGELVDAATGARSPVDQAANASTSGIDIDTFASDLTKSLQDAWNAALAFESSQKGNRLEAGAKGTAAFSKAVTSYSSAFANVLGASKEVASCISGVGAAFSAADNIMKGIFEYQHFKTVEKIARVVESNGKDEAVTKGEMLVLSRYKDAIMIKGADAALSAILDTAELITLACGGVGTPAVKLINCIYKSLKAGIGYYRDYQSMKANQADKRLGIEGGAIVREDSGAGRVDEILAQSWNDGWEKSSVKNMVEIDLQRDKLKEVIDELVELKNDPRLTSSTDPNATKTIDEKIKTSKEKLITLDKKINVGIREYNTWMVVGATSSNVIPLTEPDIKKLSDFHKKNIESILKQASEGSGNIGTKIKRWRSWIGMDDRTNKEKYLDKIIAKYGPLFDQDDEYIRKIDINEIKASGADQYFWDKTKKAIHHVAQRDKQDWKSSRVSFSDLNNEMEKILNTLSIEQLKGIDKDFFEDVNDSNKSKIISNWISTKGL